MISLIKYLTGLGIITTTLFSCGNRNDNADGYGNFEATEITVSAQANGQLLLFNIEEGQHLDKDAFIGYVDTIPLSLQHDQLHVLKDLTISKSKGVLSQISILNAKLETAIKNLNRIEKLVKDNAATQKQLDDVNGEINVIKQQISSIEIQNAPVVNELKNIDIQIKQIEDKIDKSKIFNPIAGTVLVKYAEPSEITSFGKPLYKIADLNTLDLRVYVSETQLESIKIGEEVTIKVDAKKDLKSYKGVISWIASEAEFTPKIIQTKDERIALVYAVKIFVKNDGGLKIGMPAEMWLNHQN